MKRLVALGLCVGVGAAVGVGVDVGFGSDWGYLAIPAAVAIGWLFVADPTRCQVREPPPR